MKLIRYISPCLFVLICVKITTQFIRIFKRIPTIFINWLTKHEGGNFVHEEIQKKLVHAINICKYQYFYRYIYCSTVFSLQKKKKCNKNTVVVLVALHFYSPYRSSKYETAKVEPGVKIITGWNSLAICQRNFSIHR